MSIGCVGGSRRVDRRLFLLCDIGGYPVRCSSDLHKFGVYRGCARRGKR